MYILNIIKALFWECHRTYLHYDVECTIDHKIPYKDPQQVSSKVWGMVHSSIYCTARQNFTINKCFINYIIIYHSCQITKQIILKYLCKNTYITQLIKFPNTSRIILSYRKLKVKSLLFIWCSITYFYLHTGI